MKAILRSSVAVLGLSGMAVAAGCLPHYHHVVDPCWPERYNCAARREVKSWLAPQVNNGHVLDQTIWSHNFEKGTAKLNPAGQERLWYLARRRPVPDPTIYLQTATIEEIPYDPEHPDQFAAARNKLDAERQDAVQKYLASITAGRNLSFQVVLHDPMHPDLNGLAYRGVQPLATGTGAAASMLQSYTGVLPASTGGIIGGAGGGGAGGR
jgi:hypothetical protein